MKLKLNPCVLLFFYISLVTLANHFFQAKQGNQEMESLSHVSTGISHHHTMKEKNVVSPLANQQQLIGGQIMNQECENDHDDYEECLMKRRMTIAEAHLDYIYTQHHKP